MTAPFGDEAVQAVATTSRAESSDVAARGFDPSKSPENPLRVIEGGAKTLATAIREVRARSLIARPKDDPEPIPSWAEDYWSFTTKAKQEGR